MNWSRVRGRWKQLRGAIRERWGKLSRNDVAVIRGRREMLIGRLQELYGILRAEAARQVSAFVARVAGELETARRRPAVEVHVHVERRRRPSARRSRSRRGNGGR